MGGHLRKKIKQKTTDTKKPNIFLLGFLLLPILIYLLIRHFMKLTISSGLDDSLRLCDMQGCGHYGASRGTRKHKGIDILFNPYEFVYSPFNAKVVKFGIVYNSTPEFKYIELQGFGLLSVFKIRLMYVENIDSQNVTPLNVGDVVQKGQAIGQAQNIAAYHGGGMQNHVHAEIRVLGQLVNPAPFFNLKN